MAGERGDALTQQSISIAGLGLSPLHGREIRLLRLLPGEPGSQICCEVTVVALDGRQAYTALSYAWGNPPAECTILLNGQQVSIRKNLWRFLQQARSLPQPLFDYIWIDALCVNQKNDGERTHQVALMGEIYAVAERTIAWLGPAYDSSDSGIEEICNASPQWTARKTFSNKWKSPAASAIRGICSRRYWKRLWIFQELILARQAVIMCGSRCIPLQAFRDFVLQVSSCDVSDHAAEQFELQCVRESPAAKIMQYIAQRRAETSILDLMIATQDLRCSDVRDRVFAVLSVDGGPTRTVSADYEKSIPHLINDVLRDHHHFQRPAGLDEITERCRELAKIMNINPEDVFAVVDSSPKQVSKTPKPVILHASPTIHGDESEASLEEPALDGLEDHLAGFEDEDEEDGDEGEAEDEADPYGGRRHGTPITFDWAAGWHHSAVVDCLLREGIIKAQACLVEAIKRDHYAAVAVLLEASTAQLRQRINEPISQHANALQLAVAYNRAKIAGLFIKAGADVNVRGVDFDGATEAQAAFANNYVLKIATINQYHDMVTLLLAEGARVNATCRPWAVLGGRTALGAALVSRHVATVESLLAAGADIKLEFNLATGPTIDLYSLLGAAVKDCAEREVELLLQLSARDHRRRPAAAWHTRCDAHRSLLEQAVHLRHSGIVQLLVHAGAVDDADRVDCHALSTAITLKEDAIVRLLLKHGADVNKARSGTWRTPLCAAVARQSEEMTRLLLEHGAEPDPCHSYWWLPSALHLAVDLRSEALVHILLQHGADIRVPFKGQTPISKALEYDHAGIVELLLQAGAVATSSMLLDAIQRDTSSEREQVITSMLRNGVDSNDRPNWGATTAFEKAMAVGNLGVLEIMLRFKPEIKYATIVKAVRSNSKNVAKLLLSHVGNESRYHFLRQSIDRQRATAHYPLWDMSLDREHPSASERQVIIQLILEHDEVTTRSWYEPTARELAIEVGNLEAVAILLRFEPKIEPTTLQRAAHCRERESPAILRLLIDHCVRFGEGEALRSTALRFAAVTGNLSALRSLLQSGVKFGPEISDAVRTRWLGTDSQSQLAVLQILHPQESADSLLRTVYERPKPAATVRTALLAPTAIDDENEHYDSFSMSQSDGCFVCIPFFGMRFVRFL